MTNEVIVEIKLDADLKAAEKIYRRIGLTIEEAIPFLVKYNVEQDTKPFDIPDSWLIRMSFYGVYSTTTPSKPNLPTRLSKMARGHFPKFWLKLNTSCAHSMELISRTLQSNF